MLFIICSLRVAYFLWMFGQLLFFLQKAVFLSLEYIISYVVCVFVSGN